MSQSVTPMWFGSDAQFGVLRLPSDGRARAGVVLCPAFAAEQDWYFEPLHQLSMVLVTKGFATLQFDYPGTGNSKGDIQEKWQAGCLQHGVREGLTLLREAGCERLVLVGVRLGGTVAWSIRGEVPELAATVLWDPFLTGQSFVRAQHALQVFSFATSTSSTPPSADVGIEIPGFHFGSDADVDIRALTMEGTPLTSDVPSLFVTGPKMSDRLTRIADAVGAEHVRDESEGRPVLPGPALDVTIGGIVSWVDACLDAGTVPVAVPPHADSIVVGRHPSGRDIREWAHSVGPYGLVGVTTGDEPEDGQPRVVFLSSVGPARMWVDVGRRLAAMGMTAGRFDVSGVGWSSTRDGQSRGYPNPIQTADDVARIAQMLSPSNPCDLVLVGLCISAYFALEGGIAIAARGVCAINPVLERDVDRKVASDVVVSRRRWLGSLSKRRQFDALRLALPEIGWRLLDVSGVQRSPAHGLVPLAEQGTDVLLVCGPDDGRRFTRRGGWITRRLVDSGALHYVELTELDHALLLKREQVVAEQVLVDHILGQFRDGAVPVRPAAPIEPGSERLLEVLTDYDEILP